MSGSRQSIYECWGGAMQVLRPRVFTNVGSFWNSLLFLGGGPILYFGIDPIDPRSVHYIIHCMLDRQLTRTFSNMH